MYDYSIFIGRFQPIHLGHVHVIKEALKKSKELIIVIGSHEKASDTRNPFTTEHRIEFIKDSLISVNLDRIHFVPQYDFTYNDDRWISSIQSSVNTVIHRKFNPDPIKIAIVGYNKDHSTYYLKKFPQYDLIEISPIFEDWMSSTNFRKLYFQENGWDDFCSTNIVIEQLEKFQKTKEFKNLKEEYFFIKEYKRKWENSPYTPTFNTVDAVVRQSGHILLVERKELPGKGQWALPGGFVNQTETLEEAVIRELYEETKLKVPKPVLKGSLVKRVTFDDPFRSTRGRTITECFDFNLNDSFDLPKVKGSDDAKKAFWISYSDAIKNRNKFFEDHFSILQYMIGL